MSAKKKLVKKQIVKKLIKKSKYELLIRNF
jgi:hypothetical protein